MASISTHVLDIARGTPANGLAVQLKKNGVVISEGVTQENGRSPSNFFSRTKLDLGVYVLHFNTAPYAARQGTKIFFPEILVHFDVLASEQDFHVPLLISPFGYSTYRGC